MTGFIYLIEAEVGRVKIGFSHCPKTRLATMSVSSVCPLRLIAQWPGCRRDEQALHKQFSDFRRHGEWFLVSGELATFVAESRGRGVAPVPNWPSSYWEASAGRRSEISKRRSESQKRNWSDPEFRAMQATFRERRNARAKQSEALA